MNLSELGYNNKLENLRRELNLQDFEIGRVIAEHRERYIVKTAEQETEAEITGNLRFSASGRQDFPAVGDWVALMLFEGGPAIIHKVLPRLSVIKRQAAGHRGEVQIIAANIDTAFLVQAVDRDFNINRLERYLTISNASKVSPVIVLTKTDLIDEQRLAEIIAKIRQRIPDVPVIAVSNQNQSGYDELKSLIHSRKTYCMLGSSGVGKSTLLNNLSGRDQMKTDTISKSSNRGRHITTHRELIVLESGGILIDNPGMREVGITNASGGLETTFDRIVSLAEQCKFKDCTHTAETGCAVTSAVETGEIDQDAYENYLKMEREKCHFESTVAEKRKKDKDFGKMVRNFKKDIKQIKRNRL